MTVAHLYSLPTKERGASLSKSLEDMGLRFTVQHFSQNEYDGSNIIVDSYYEKGQPTVLITSHYDGPGAYDNAGGVVTLLWLIRWARLATTKSREKLSVLFGFLDGEERGLLGAKHFVRNNATSELRGHISLDGFGIGTDIAGFANLKEIGLKTNFGEEVFALGADTIVFQEKGIPSFHLFTLPEKELIDLVRDSLFPPIWRIVHTEEDSPDKIDDSFIPFVSLKLYEALPSIDFEKSGIITVGNDDGH